MWTFAPRSVRYSSLPAFASLDRLRDVEGDRARLRVRHQAARAEHPAEPPDDAHLVGCRDRDVEVGEALLDALRQVGGADHVGSGLLGLARLVALGEDGDACLAAGAVRQHHRAAELLVRVADVQAQVHVHLDRLVELGRRARLAAAGSPATGEYSSSRSNVLRAAL